MKKILIIKHGALGDVILSMHPVFAIWKHFKGYEISVLTESKYKELFQCLPFIKNIKIDNRPKFYYVLKYIKIFKWFYKSDFEWIFDLQTSKRTNLYFLILSIFKDFNWNGIAKNCSHPHLSLNRKKLHTLERQKDQLRAAGISKAFNPDWNYFKSKTSKFSIKKSYAILVPGGSRHRKNKRWDFKNFLEIIKFLMSSVIISLILFSFTIITFLPIGAHNVGSEAPPNNTILAILSLLHATNKCIGPVSFPKTSFAPEDKYAKSEKLVLPIKLTTE